MSTIVKVIVLCFVVGFSISVFDIDPGAILTDTWHTIRDVAGLLESLVRWALPYTLIGAVVVLPLLAIGYVLRRARGGRGGF